MRIIVVAEHEDARRQHLALALEGVASWIVAAVPTGSELLELVAAIRPDLVLLDVQLPGVDGIKVYRKLRERKGMRQVPVVFVTGTPQPVERARLDGPYAILRTPFDHSDLLARVTAMLGEPQPEV